MNTPVKIAQKTKVRYLSEYFVYAYAVDNMLLLLNHQFLARDYLASIIKVIQLTNIINLETIIKTYTIQILTTFYDMSGSFRMGYVFLC